MSRSLWREIQAQNIRSFKMLTAHLELDTDELKTIDIDPSFPVNIPLRLVDKMEKGNLKDPLFLQFVPLKMERAENGCADPVGDQDARITDRLLHKYQGRALITVTSACAMHCRYCFRKEFPYAVSGGYEKELEAIRADTSISEVILSGGDPLSLSNESLKKLLVDIDQIPHVKLIRFHSRFPMGIPERIDTEFLALLTTLRSQVWFVVHVNHARELDADVASALKKIQCLGIPLLNQSVLLRGVNDTFEVHKELLDRLITCGIQPYYLHQLDPVIGAKHFEVSPHEGLQLIEELRAKMPGYALPSYVQEIAGGLSKEPLLPENLKKRDPCASASLASPAF